MSKDRVVCASRPRTGPRLGDTFDDVGNLKSVQSGRQGGTRVQTYGHDGLNRLTEVKDASGVG
ncbi:MAG: RHS repeat domain-containing protein [Lysobacteraceae bacterium]